MGKSATIFVALCMVTVAVSLAIISMSGFGLPLGDAMFVGVGSLAIFGLIQAVFTRSGLEPAAAAPDFNRSARDLWDRIRAIEERLTHHEALMRDSARVVVEPVSEEIAEIGTLISQLAEQVETQELAIDALRSAAEAQDAVMQTLTAPQGFMQASPAPERPVPETPAPDTHPADTRLARAPSMLNGVHTDPLPAALSEIRAELRRAPEQDAAPPVPRVRSTPVSAPVPALATAPSVARDAAPAVAALRPTASEPEGGTLDAEAVRRALAEDRIEIHLQPIVALPQRRVLFYEATPRLRDADGRTRMPMEFLPAARAGGLVPVLDRFVIERGLMIAERLKARGRDLGLFVAISPGILADDASFADLAVMLERWRDQAGRIVLMLRQESLRNMGALEHETLRGLAERGFRFGVDHITDLAFDPRALHALGIRYAKVAADVVLHPDSSVASEIHPGDVPGLLKRHGIAFIATRVETEATVANLLDYDISHAQGLLFGPPRPVRSEIFGDLAKPLPAAAPLPRAAASTGLRQPATRPAIRPERFEQGFARRV